MKKLVFGLIATLLFGSLSYGQRDLTDEETKSLQEILNKVSRIAEEKGKIVSFDLSYKEVFTNNDYSIDEDGNLAKKLTNSYGEKFNDLKGKVKIDCPQLFELGDVNGVGNAVIGCSRAKGVYVPRSFGGGDGQDFKSLYEDYKKSTTELYSKLDEFDKKLNVDVDESVFKSEESFMEWLKKNISKTEYKAPEDALKDYNEQISLMTEIITKNTDFLKQIEKNNGEFLKLLAESPLNGNPITSYSRPPDNATQGCINDCINGAVSCSNDADSAYSDTMIASAATFGAGNAFAAGVIAWGGYRTHKRAIKACLRNFTSCTGGC